MSKQNQRLLFFLSETHYFAENYSIGIIGLVGHLAERNGGVLQECQEAVEKSSAKIMILNFRDVEAGIDTGALFLMASLLESIRRKPAIIRMSGVHPALRKVLESKGICKPEEFVNNLADAFQSLKEMNLAA